MKTIDSMSVGNIVGLLITVNMFDGVLPGDICHWIAHRDGVTKRERGIPLGIFQDTIKKEGFKIISSHRVMNPFSKRIFSIVNYPFNKKFTTQLDYFFSKLLSFNKRYHSTRWYHKIQPQSIFYVLMACKE